MTDNDILLALSNMLEPIRDDIIDIKTDLIDVKADLNDVKNDLKDVSGRVKKIALTQENVIFPRLQNIESCYTSTYERYKNSVDDYDAMKQDIAIIKQVVLEHSEKLQKIS